MSVSQEGFAVRPSRFVLLTSFLSICAVPGGFQHSFILAEEGTDSTAGKVKVVSRVSDVDADPSAEKYLLQYRLREGESINTRVTHLAKTLTKVNDQEESSHSRTVSTKNWKVVSLTTDGNMTFEHSVREVDASNKVGQAEEVRYNSGDGEVPTQFKEVDSQVDQVISTITMRPNGEVVERTTDDKYARLGLGEIAVQFPEQPIAIGDQWETTREIQVRRPDKTPMRVSLREVFTLKKVSAGVALIEVRNEPLTPIRSPEVESQVMQQMNNGTMKFDMDAGRLLSKDISWDSTVIGFNGAGSRLEYSARLEEVLVED